MLQGELQEEEHYVYDEHQHLLGQYQLLAGSVLPEQEVIWLGDIPVATLQGGPVYDDNGDYLGWRTELLRLYTDHRNAVRRMSFAFSRPSDYPPAYQYTWIGPEYFDVNGYGPTLSYYDESVTPDEDYEGFSLRFPGQMSPTVLPDTISYNMARDYDPLSGRYLESDPIGLAGGSYSTYAYARGNPLSNVDPLGLWGGGITVSVSTINPFTSGGGGTYGFNLEYTSGGGWGLYSVGTPNDVPSQGFLPGLSVTLNGATGNGD